MLRTAERDEVTQQVIEFCQTNDVEPTPRNVIAALDALGLLKDQADQEGTVEQATA